MKKIWFLIAGVALSTSLFSWADPVKTDAPPKVEESNPDADKAAVNAASSDADKWTATQKAAAVKPPDVPVAVQPPASAPVPAAAPTPVPAAAAAPVPDTAPAKTPVVHRTGLNEMTGKFQSHGEDPRTLRVMVDGGYNVEFTYDGKTAMSNGGGPLSMDDLNYGDEVVVRYAGKELYAVEIERLSKAPRPQ